MATGRIDSVKARRGMLRLRIIYKLVICGRSSNPPVSGLAILACASLMLCESIG